MQILRTDPDRFGIRARLLTLLLPAILGLLVLDSWNDYRALRNLVQDAYDRSLLEMVVTLRDGLLPGSDGALQLTAPALAAYAAINSAYGSGTNAPRIFLHVGLTPKVLGQGVGAAAPRELTLLGEAALPTPQNSSLLLSPSPAVASAPSLLPAGTLVPVWYDSFYLGERVRVVTLQGEIKDGHSQAFDLLIQAAEGTGPRDRAQAASAQQALLRDARMVLVVILLVWIGVTWSLQPLERLRKSVLQSKGHALKPLETTDVPHEVAPLVDALNQHVASYRDLLDQQAQFLADASHQLRTPLAIMLTQAGVALREKDPEQVRGTLRAIVTQISRSRRLCEQLLSLAHASDSAPAEGVPDAVDLGAVAKEVVLQYLTLAHEKNQDLGWMDARHETLTACSPVDAASVISAPITVLARGPELHEALSNLVHNAIVYTPRGGRITVMVDISGGMACAEVRDDGPGIAEARRTAVFERFIHGSTDSGHGTNPSARGAGLGLAIAPAYARRNGGDIVLGDVDLAVGAGVPPARIGLRAILRLPLAS